MSEEKEFSEIAFKILSRLENKEILRRMITEGIEEEFNIKLPLSESGRYPIEKIKKLIEVLIDMIVLSISKKPSP